MTTIHRQRSPLVLRLGAGAFGAVLGLAGLASPAGAATRPAATIQLGATLPILAGLTGAGEAPSSITAALAQTQVLDTIGAGAGLGLDTTGAPTLSATLAILSSLGRAYPPHD
jgi:hypothetical protein